MRNRSRRPKPTVASMSAFAHITSALYGAGRGGDTTISQTYGTGRCGGVVDRGTTVAKPSDAGGGARSPPPAGA